MASTDQIAVVNSCVNCKFEETCGYSPLAMLKRRTENSYGPCALGLMSPHGNREPRPFFHPKGFEYTPDEEIALEVAHRAASPVAEWHYVVRLSFGDFDRVKQLDYDAAVNSGRSNSFLRLVSGAWRMVEDLTIIKSE
jgi:hypothetical protein